MPYRRALLALPGTMADRAAHVRSAWRGSRQPVEELPGPDMPLSFAELVAASALLDFGSIANDRWPGFARGSRSRGEE